jgi:hypothetical protein
MQKKIFFISADTPAIDCKPGRLKYISWFIENTSSNYSEIIKSWLGFPHKN